VLGFGFLLHFNDVYYGPIVLDIAPVNFIR